ncbi:ABC transporter [Dyella thiooxydans]|uniref:ABC transporter n=1 Tax=Dyella thiooxydans TaxID=445710 RepID=A0A160N266_9GAMM|nr:VacJ family lipoprotein [Dyella thiooxydans]AND69860.1 ABC transporter [Dyella thiooxydans]
MPFPHIPSWLRRTAALGLVCLLAGCAIAKPRTDDPLEKVNRKVYAFNDAVDQAVIRPVAVGYRKITNPPVRRSVSDFFTNLRQPVTVANDLLQARPKQALQSTGRFLVNLTLGIGGLFDPASSLGLPLQQTDFGVTLARWGVPEGDYIVLPFLGPSTVRDVWQVPVDGYFFDPLTIYARNHSYHYGQQYIPQLVYLVNLRSRAFDAEGFLKSAYDPYVFVRDAYRQRRLYKIYDGNPPASVIDQMQGLDQQGFDPDQLLQEQHQWENKHPKQAEQADQSAGGQ